MDKQIIQVFKGHGMEKNQKLVDGFFMVNSGIET